jgi:hypothetical protein
VGDRGDERILAGPAGAIDETEILTSRRGRTLLRARIGARNDNVLRHEVVAHLLPILASVPGDHGLTHLTPLIGDDPVGRAMLATLWRDIPFSVDAIRKFWMPIRFKTRAPKPPRRKGR